MSDANYSVTDVRLPIDEILRMPEDLLFSLLIKSLEFSFNLAVGISSKNDAYRPLRYKLEQELRALRIQKYELHL